MTGFIRNILLQVVWRSEGTWSHCWYLPVFLLLLLEGVSIEQGLYLVVLLEHGQVIDDSTAVAEKLRAAVAKSQVGDGLKDPVQFGPLINMDAVEKVEEHIADVLAGDLGV